MKVLFTAEAISKGGRSGTIQNPEGLLDVTLGNPLEKGIEKRGPNPEMLFAGAYSACYHGALVNAGKTLGMPIDDSTVRALVSLIEDDKGGYRISVELHAQIPTLNKTQVLRIMHEAHSTCPYSKALRGDASVTLVVDKTESTRRSADPQVFSRVSARKKPSSKLSSSEVSAHEVISILHRHRM